MIPAASTASPTTRLICASAACPPSPEYPAVPFPAKLVMVWPDATTAANSGRIILVCILILLQDQMFPLSCQARPAIPEPLRALATRPRSRAPTATLGRNRTVGAAE